MLSLVLLYLLLIVVLNEIELCECVLLHHHFFTSLIYATYPLDTFWSLVLETQIVLLILPLLKPMFSVIEYVKLHYFQSNC
jgi:hypothetical protein